MHRLPLFFAKAAITFLLLYISLRQVDLIHIGHQLSDVDWLWIAAVLVVMAAQVGLNALRWCDISGVCGTQLRVMTALGFTFIGQFFNQVLPSTIGGDAARIWLLAQDGASWPTAIFRIYRSRRRSYGFGGAGDGVFAVDTNTST